MTSARLPRLSTRLPAEICPAAGFGEAAPALAAASDATQLLYDLMARKEWPAAVSLLAHTLPKPDAVWWASECARISLQDDEPAVNIAALGAAQGWVTSPGEPSRRAAEQAAAKADSSSPCAMAAYAAFFSGGSIVPAGAPELPAPEHLCGTMAATAVMLAAAASDPGQVEARYQTFLDGGIQLARE